MTDPRVIECAKAFDAEADIDFDGIITNLPDAIRAAILKWLEQTPTDAMCASARALGNEYNEYNAGEDAAYTAMCAQAAKEIAQ